jgi:GNAT superfamily N-acetyltransferase
MDLITVLTAGTARPYAPLTYPHFRPLLAAFEQFQDLTLAVGYAVSGTPVGLALAQTCADCQAAHLRSVFVHSAYRGKGIGKALLARLEQEVVRRPYPRLDTEYPRGRPETPYWEHILSQRGWQPPQVTCLRCAVIGKVAVDALMAAPWMRQPPALPPEAELFPWQDLGTDERGYLEGQQAAERYEHGIEPVLGARPADPLNSLGLRYRGEVIGWMLTVRTAPGRMLYDRLYVDARYRPSGYGVALVVEAIRRQYAQEGQLPEVGGVWRTHVENRPMVQFIRRRFGPYLSSLVEINTSYKELARSAP